MTDLKRFKVEEYLIKELFLEKIEGVEKIEGFELKVDGRSIYRVRRYWVDSHYKYHGSFDTREEAEVLLKQLQKRPTGYTHYRITC